MSESDQEKTEQPSDRRIEKSREKGQIPRSRELTSALLLMSASFILQMAATPAGNIFQRIITLNLSLDRAAVFDTQVMNRHLLESFMLIAPIAIMVLGGMLVIALISQLLVGGWVFNAHMLQPKFSRMNPGQWFGRVFSKKGAVELLKSILKVLLVIGALIWLLNHYYPLLISTSRMSFRPALSTGLSVLSIALFAYACTLLLISAIDAPFQIWENHQKLKMTRQEVKDEHKDIEGRPEVKQKIRQLQREMANRRMIQRIPDADVVIVNPTHYSVALKYDQDRAKAPFVIAKGVDHMAFMIRDAAKSHDIQIVETPVLTRAIYYSTDIDQEIPADLYLAVAQVLAYVFQISQFRQGKANSAPTMPTPEIPEDYLQEDYLQNKRV